MWSVAASVLLLTQANAQEWGSIKGRIVYSGKAPQAAVLDIERDAEVCGNHGLVDESLIVNEKTGGIRYVAIWLDSKKPVPVHPELAAKADKPPVLDNLNCRFEPHMLAVQTGQKLLLKNSDPVVHNAAVYVRRTTPFNEVIPQGQTVDKTFSKPETQPTRVDCSIHAWMKAWFIITDHPYVAITDEDGNFELQNVPAGEWNFRFWHERPGYLQSLTQDGTACPISKGTWTLTVPDSGLLELGDLVASEDQFAGKKR
jgi:plastocyanin